MIDVVDIALMTMALSHYGIDVSKLSPSDFSIRQVYHNIHSRCLRCGKALKNPVAQERGYGEVCWKKHLTDKQTTLF